jgi:NADH dehydrogenase/NADH:ubiquinone oxidoreductase subunit G
MISLSIDGHEIQAEEGATILEVARDNGIEIPTLCYHEALESYGACRLCMVEIVIGSRPRLVASCCYPAEEGLEVRTNSERVIKFRKGVVELLLARCPSVKAIQDLAQGMGIESPRFGLKEEDCILCGLCVRACTEVVGVSAISLVGRGMDREVATPFYEPSKTCIGCASCAAVCPTKAIKVEDVGNTRRIRNWKVEFELQQCKTCGKYFAPKAQLEYLWQKSGLPQEFFEICPDCMRGNRQ